MSNPTHAIDFPERVSRRCHDQYHCLPQACAPNITIVWTWQRSYITCCDCSYLLFYLLSRTKRAILPNVMEIETVVRIYGKGRRGDPVEELFSS